MSARHLTTERFEERSAITGIGASRLGRRLMVPPLSLTIDACEAAIADAGLTFEDIDGLSTYPGPSTSTGIGKGGVTALEGALGHPPGVDQRRHGHLRDQAARSSPR